MQAAVSGRGEGIVGQLVVERRVEVAWLDVVEVAFGELVGEGARVDEEELSLDGAAGVEEEAGCGVDVALSAADVFLDRLGDQLAKDLGGGGTVGSVLSWRYIWSSMRVSWTPHSTSSSTKRVTCLGAGFSFMLPLCREGAVLAPPFSGAAIWQAKESQTAFLDG